MKRSQGTWLHVLTLCSLLCFTLAASPLARAADESAPEAAEMDSNKPMVAAEAEDENAKAPETNATEETSESPSKGRINKEAVVVFGQNVELKANETAEVVVVIGGSAKIHGKVKEGVVVIGGDAEVDGEVNDQVVTVMGSAHIRSGAVVRGDVVCVGGRLEVDDGAQVKGNTQEVAIGGMRMPHADWIQKWLSSCVLMLRPLSPSVGWVWIVALVHFLLFLLIAAVFRTPVNACVNELRTRPATTFLMGLLTKMILPVVILILIVLVVGLVVLPFILAAVFVLGLVGKVAVLEAMGSSAGGLLGKKPVESPVVALIIGSAILAILYMIPVVGLLTMLLLSVWGLGCAITAAFHGFRHEVPQKTIPQPIAPAPITNMAGAVPPMTSYTQPFSQQASAVGSTPSSGAATVGPAPDLTATAALPGEPPVMAEVLAYPRATFWERMGADVLDLILVVILGIMVHSPTFTLVIGLAYVTALWTWRGTTIGGIILGLKVVRMDGQPLTFPVALVRGLMAGFSAVVLFLGFIWIAWDQDKQGWHDKVAGTVVLRLPRGTPLICV